MNQTMFINLKSKLLCSRISKTLLIFILCIIHIGVYAQDVNQQEGTLKISGRITDDKGEPVIGVVIQEIGTNNGVISDLDGNYSIYNVKNNKSKIRISYTGFKPVEFVVGQKRIYDIILEPDIMGLNEVVVVGYGSQKKESVIGSISTVKPEILQSNQSATLSNSLAGLVAGIVGVQRTGELGQTNAEFYIRGMSTFSQGNRTPLVLVDGIERSMDNISAEEIESFSVLKDAAATAVYGVRGANGAILIKTKRGTIGKPQVSVKANYGITTPTKMPKFVKGPKYMEATNAAYKLSGLPTPYSQEAIDNTRSGVDPDLYPDVNWVDAVMEDYASNQNVSVDVSGGTERLKYRFIVGVYNEYGMTKTDKSVAWHDDAKYRFQKYNVRSNVDMDITSSTALSFSVGGFITDKNMPGGGDGSGIISTAMQAPPTMFPIQYSTGEFAKSSNGTNAWITATQTGYKRQYNNGVQSLITLAQDIGKLWDPLTGLSVKGTFSFDTYNYHNTDRYRYPSTYIASGRDNNGDLILTLTNTGDEFLGFSKSSGGNRRIYFELPLTYDRTFSEMHGVGAMLLFNRDSYVNHDADNAIAAFPNRHQGLAGRFTYNYNQKYFTEFNFGYNGSENFKSGYRYGFFPSFALGWLVSNEKFMQSTSHIISKLKLRGSWGKIGNDNIGGRRFAYVSTINNTGGYEFGYNSQSVYSGLREGAFGIENLTWEISNKTDIGIELGLFNGLNITLDLYKDNRSKIFMQRKTLTETAGYTEMPWANFGKVNNKGIDINIDYNKAFSKDFSVSLLGNFTYTTNKVLEDDESENILNSPRSRTGKPMNIPMLFIAERLFQDDDFDADGTLKNGIPEQTFGKVQPGDIKYKDLNNDGKITDEDQTLYGDPLLPKIIYGFGFTINYKNIDFGTIFQGAAQTSLVLDITSDQNYLIPGSGGMSRGNILDNVDDRWTPENSSQNVFWPRLYNLNTGNNNKASTWWQKDASFLRLKNIEIGYTPFKNSKTMRQFKNTRLFLRGSNLFYLSSFKLWDPELGGDGYRKYPMNRYTSLGFELYF